MATEEEYNNNQWKDLGTNYSGDSTIKALTVSQLENHTLTSIEVTGTYKNTYYEGEDFNKQGMVVTAYYNDDSSNVLSENEYEISGGTNLSKNQASVTISYQGKTKAVPITVQENTVTAISVKTPPTKTTDYNPGRDFEPDGMIIEATYSSGATKTITNYTVTNGKNLKNGQTSVTISYNENENIKTTQNITVKSIPLKGITIEHEPDKKSYVVGQNFDKNGMIVKATYGDDNNEEYTVVLTEYIVEDGDNLTKDKTKVTIKYEDGETKLAEQTIEVVEKALTSIQVSKNPTKMSYIKNKETLDLTGGKIKLTYNDGTTEEINMTNEQVKATGFSNEEAKNITITLTYLEKTTTLQVEIVEEETAQSSKLDEAKAKIANYKLEGNKIIIDVEVSNIERNEKNDSVEYYYYLSPNKNEKTSEIEDWVKIDEKQTNNDKLAFQINSEDLKNYSELSSANSVYLYIKEVAKKGGDQKIGYAGPMKLNVENTNIEQLAGETGTPAALGNDTTTANTILPKAGMGKILVVIAIITVVGIIIFIRYKKLSKYV